MASSLICSETHCRVSSVLNRDVKQYGKKYLFDRNEETCWNSDQGECQWVCLEFPQSVKVSELKVQFQGGFSAKTCRLDGCPKRWGLYRDQPFLSRGRQLSSAFPYRRPLQWTK